MAHDSPARDDVADRINALLAQLAAWQREFRSTLLADYDALGSIAPILMQFDDTVDEFQRAACCIWCEERIGTVLLDPSRESCARYCAACAALVITSTLHSCQPEGTRAPGVFGAEAVGR